MAEPSPCPLALPCRAERKGTTVYFVPKMVPLTKRNVDTRPVASLPASITGVLPHPLGKTATRPAVRAWKWFDECDVDNPRLDALYQEARAISGRERNLAQHVTFTHVTWQSAQITTPCGRQPPRQHLSLDCLLVKEPRRDSSTRLQGTWSSHRRRSIEVWLWGRQVAPKSYKDEFLDALWEIFVPFG